jgi:hypothetical protein
LSDPLSQPVAAVVLLAYTALFAAIGIWITSRRDVS